MSGTASEVVGMMAETRFIKTVSERRTVTSERGRKEAGRGSTAIDRSLTLAHEREDLPLLLELQVTRGHLITK